MPAAGLFPPRAAALAPLLLAAWLAAGASAQAALFEDSEARQAILELRQRVEALQQSGQRAAGDEARRAAEDNALLRRSLLDLQTQIETLRTEQARLTGQNEQWQRQLAELQRQLAQLQRGQQDLSQGVDERLRQFEPVKVALDGREFLADPAEKRDFEAALALFRAGKFADAGQAFSAFTLRHARSGYLPSARFWLGNAQYATREYKEAIGNFRQMLAQAPGHARAAEAQLSIANCQIELKEQRSARKTLEELILAYPQSEAAQAAKERLAHLK